MDCELKDTNKSTEKITRKEDDYIVKSIGAFGLWQAGVCIVASLTRFITLWNMLSIVFLTPVTNFICAKFERNVTVIDIENSTCYNDCIQYEFYKDIFDETLISEFGLICKKSWMAGLIQTVMMFGLLVGIVLFGWISDRYGRRKALISSSITNVVLMLTIPLSPNYWIFVALRFLIGVASGGTLTIGVVYILETVGSKYRESAGALAILPDGLAEASLSGFAYYSPNWRVYLIGYAGVSVVFALLMVLLPETPRWLMSKGKVDKAIEVLTKIANFNKQDTSQIESHVKEAAKDITHAEIIQPSYLDLFKDKFKILAKTVIWTTAGACYFGINQYVTFFGSNLLITVILLGLIQVPVTVSTIILNKLGRKIATISTLLTTGITMLTLAFLPQDHWASTTLGIIGFAACSATFSIIYVFTGELFPTLTRNMAYGFCTTTAKMGSMVVPFIVILKPYWVPSFIFAAMVFTSAVFCSFLPETKARKLTD